MHARIVNQLSQHLITTGVNVTWEGYARMDRPWFDPAFLNRASRAGLRKVYVGLELIDPIHRDVLQKKDRLNAKSFLQGLADAGILVHLFVLVGHPGTGQEDALRTVAFALENRHLIDTLEISGFRYEKHTLIEGVQRRPDPLRDWALYDPYVSTLEPTLSSVNVAYLEAELFHGCGTAVPRWVHPIHYMISPWAASDRLTPTPSIWSPAK